jgi:DNA-binding transcriptional LysR family regulator
LRAEKFDAVHENKVMDRGPIYNANIRMLDIPPMNSEIDLNLLLVFDAVWRHRHISRAAIELNTSQPTVSNALRRLRDFTRDALFVRSGSGMEPTPFAEQLAIDWCNGLSSVRRLAGGQASTSPPTSARSRS